MNIPEVHAFVAVAEAGSIHRAARRLNLSQPATTRRIQTFEASLRSDLPLFDRSVKPAVLTAHGLLVLEQARRVLQSMDALMTSGTTTINPSGTLKVGVAHGLGEMVLSSPFDNLQRNFSKVKLQISSNWSTELIHNVRTGAIECAVALLTDSHIVPEGITRVSLGPEQIVVIAAASKTHPRGGRRWHLHDLANEGWLLNPPGCGCRLALARALDEMQLPLHIAAEVFGEDLQLSLLARSGGFGLVPQRQFNDSPHRNKLQILDVVDFHLLASVSLIRNSISGQFSEPINALTSELQLKLR